MKERPKHVKRTFTFSRRGKRPHVVVIEATSKGKAWREFRRHHVTHAKKKEYAIDEVTQNVLL
ncbi:MAG: hypothetical protein V3T23_02160 [Nitrososphaerales archaeon]